MWCKFHEQWPHKEWQSKVECLWKGDSFKDVLELFELKGLEECASSVVQLGIRTPKQLAEVDLETLWNKGWSEEHTAILWNTRVKVPEKKKVET